MFRLMMLKNRCGQSGNGAVKLTVSNEKTDGRNYFLHLIFCMLVQILES